jgi:hypothetical protein
VSRGPLTTTQLRAAWSPPCAAVQGVKVELYGGAVITIDKRIVPAVLAMNAVFAKWNYKCTPPDTGAFVCRRITGGTGYSLHAYLIAIDINWQTNPYTKGALITDMPRGMVTEITNLRTNNGAPVWGWGGNYRSVKDAMHYEIVCTPADLATGIKDAAPAPLTADQKALVFISAKAHAAKLPELGRGHVKRPHRRSVAKLQQLLGMRRTGVYGTATRAKVKAVQTFLRLPVTGVVDQETWAWIIYAALVKGR